MVLFYYAFISCSPLFTTLVEKGSEYINSAEHFSYLLDGTPFERRSLFEVKKLFYF